MAGFTVVVASLSVKQEAAQRRGSVIFLMSVAGKEEPDPH